MGKLLVLPGRATVNQILKEIKTDYDCKKPHEILVIVHTVNGENSGIMTNVHDSPTKIWMLEQAKLLILSGDLS